MSKKGRGVVFQNADEGKIDKKVEGYSNLRGKYDTQKKKAERAQGQGIADEADDQLITCLQRQILVMEHEIRLLKEREVDQKNKASGYETLLRDKIPLNEHFLALKTKYNNEKNLLDKNIEAMRENIEREELKNKEKKNKINVYKHQNKEAETKFT